MTAIPAKARALIRTLDLKPHPEGGYYREIHRSKETVGTARGRRSAITTIYFLLARGQRSVFHRVLSDEIWHWYAGAKLRLHEVTPDFRSHTTHFMGPAAKGSIQTHAIPRNAWQAAETTGGYTLVGCSVGPGFDFKDFTLLRDDARAAARLAKVFPDLSALI